jgi:ABC-type sugar transport system, ATPase component
MENINVLEVKQIDKSFPGVQALSDINVMFKGGQIHCLAGENGAGKSTLMNIMSGVYPPDSGEIFWNGEKVEISDEIRAQKLGIAMVHQENSLISSLTVQENLFLGRYMSNRAGFISQKKMNAAALELLGQLDINYISPKDLVSSLSVAEKQLVEIAKALSFNPKVIIFDEPTAALTSKEVNTLFGIMARLKKNNVVIIYISHRLDEIFEIGDMVSVLRDGHLLHVCPISDIDKTKLISLMVGHEIKQSRYRDAKGEFDRNVILEVRNLGRKDQFSSINFTLKRGEVLGFAGLVGSGRTEVMETLYGFRRQDAGEVFIEGKKRTSKAPMMRSRSGLA